VSIGNNPLKEPYFTPAAITATALQMLKSLEPFTRKRPVHISPNHAALLVLDMQAYFLVESSHAFVPSSTAILPGVNALIRLFTDLHRPVVFTRHLNTLQDAGLMATWWRDLITADHPLSSIDPRLEIQDAVVVNKTRYDAFIDTPLEKLLQEKGIRQLVVCGVMTHLCCETTARSAFMRGFEVFFTVDGTATYTEAFHRASLLNLAHGFATPVLVQDILSKLEKYENR
jgi:bifunctional isochorismate lyase/aryl carrier protein